MSIDINVTNEIVEINETSQIVEINAASGIIEYDPVNLITNVRNQTGSTISKLKVVYISGATGNKPLVLLASNTTEDASSKTYGVTRDEIANNGTGYVVTVGELRNVNTQAYNEGDQLWLGVNGNVITAPPAEPAHSVFIGFIIRKHPNLGVVDVRIQNGYELDELHGVQITTPTNGQVLKYDSTSGLWINAADSAPVSSVFGRTGAVVATEGDYSLTQLSDVTLTSPTTNQVLKYNGTTWVNDSDTDTGITTLNTLTATTQTFSTGTSGTNFNISSATSTHTFNIPDAGPSSRGLITSSTQTIAGVKTFTGTSININNILNLEQYAILQKLTLSSGSPSSGKGYIWYNSATNTLYFRNDANVNYDLTANSGGTVTSVGMSVPTGFAVTGSPITSSGTLALAFASGYALPTTASQTNWDAAYNDKINSAAVTGTTTKTLTLTQQDGGTITASWTDDNTDAVTSVFGRTGAVTAAEGDYSLTQLSDVTITSASNGQVLKYNGTSWVNDSDAGLTGSGTTNEIAYFTGATTLGSLTTATYPSLTELSYVKGVTSAIQTQINAKFTLPSLTSGSVLFSNGTTIAQDNANFFWDDTNNRLGIGTTSPALRTHISASGAGSPATSGTSQTGPLRLSNSFSGLVIDYGFYTTNLAWMQVTNSGNLSVNYPLVLNPNGGNIIISSSTDTGEKLQVTGTAKITSNLAVDTSTLFVDATNDRVGIGTTSPTQRLAILDGSIAVMSTAAGGLEVFRIGVGTTTSQFAVNLGGTTGFAYQTISDTTKGQMFVRNSHTNNFPAYSFLTDTNTGFSNANGTADTLSFITNGTEAARFFSTQNFSIGSTTDSGERLQVTGTMKVTGALTAASFIPSGSSVPTNGMYLPTTNTLAWSTNTTERLRLDASGNLLVGGTSVYGSTITSYASATRSGGIGIRNSAGTGAGGFYTYASGSGSGSTDIYVESSGFMAFASAGTERFRLTSAGRLLLGTTTESTFLLDVNGTARVSGAATISGTITSGTSSTSQVRTYLATNIASIEMQGGAGSDSAAQSAYIRLGDVTNSKYVMNQINSTGGLAYWFFNGSSWSNSASILPTGAATFSSSVTAASFIPSGSTVPTNGMYLPTTNTLAWSTNSAERMRLDASGRLGIGTSTVTSLLTLSAAGSHYAQFVNTATSSSAWFGNFSGGAWIEAQGANNIYFQNNSSERMRITAAGRLLLGTTTESTFLLDVNGTARVSGNLTVTGNSPLFTGGALEIQGSANAVKTFYINRYGVASGSQHRLRAENAYFEIASANSEAIVLTGGNVGISQTSPTAFLDVKAATTAAASLRLRSGTAPTAPNDGDIWFDGTDLKIQIGGVTKTVTVT